MPLTFNVRHLDKDDLELNGELSADELELNELDELITVKEPVRYDLTAERLNESILVRGSVQCTLSCQCVRCLKAFEQELVLDDWACDLPLEGEDRIPIENDIVDLTPYLREDTMLAFPRHPLCEADCPGLAGPGNNLIASASVPGQDQGTSAAWAELNKLKF